MSAPGSNVVKFPTHHFLRVDRRPRDGLDELLDEIEWAYNRLPATRRADFLWMVRWAASHPRGGPVSAPDDGGSAA